MRRPKVKLDNLIALLTVAAKGNIDAAADELGLSSSAVRKQLESIESVLGVRFFESVKGRLELTEDGESFHEDAKKTVDQALLAEEKVHARRVLKRQQLRIGHSTYLPPKLIALINQIRIDEQPGLRMEHVSGMTSSIASRVMEGSLHVGFGFLPLPFPELLVRVVHEEPIVVCIPSNHRLTSKAIIFPQDLDGEPMISVAKEPFPPFHKRIEDHFRDFGIDLQIVADAYAPPEALIYVAQRMGICLLTRSSVTPRTEITVKPLTTPVLTQRAGVFLREDDRSPLLERLIDNIVRQSALLQRKVE